MKNDSREEILRNIKKGLYGDTARKEGGILSRNGDRDFGKEAEDLKRDRLLHIERLVELFIKELLNVNTEVQQIETEVELKAYIIELARRKRALSFAIWDTEYLRSLGLTDFLKGKGLREIKSNDKNEIAEAGIGISGADYAIADTGTIVLLTDENRPRSVSLLPPVHVAIVKKSDIVSNIRELFIILKQTLDTTQSVPSCMTFITGPSRTADIELNLTLGVHGPKELYVIITPD
ncbi:MAG: lactate utilization protein C [Thermodesulfobacteriota bacterium]